MAWTSPRTWVSGEVPTATIFNTHVRDNLLAASTWTTYTSTWGGAVSNPAIGNGTKTSAYIKIGDRVDFYVSITMGSTTTYGSGGWSITLPFAPLSGLWVFQGGIDDNSAGLYPLMGFAQSSSTTVDFRTDPTTAGNNVRSVTATAPITFATGDRLFLSGTYRSS